MQYYPDPRSGPRYVILEIILIQKTKIYASYELYMALRTLLLSPH